MSDLLTDHRHPDLAALYRAWWLAGATSDGLPSIKFGTAALAQWSGRTRLVAAGKHGPINSSDAQVDEGLSRALEAVISSLKPLTIERTEHGSVRVATVLLPLSDSLDAEAVLIGRFVLESRNGERSEGSFAAQDTD